MNKLNLTNYVNDLIEYTQKIIDATQNNEPQGLIQTYNNSLDNKLQYTLDYIQVNTTNQFIINNFSKITHTRNIISNDFIKQLYEPKSKEFINLKSHIEHFKYLVSLIDN